MAMSAKAEEQNSHSRIFQSEAATRIAHYPEVKLREHRQESTGK
jgi:hypothetical protein